MQATIMQMTPPKNTTFENKDDSNSGKRITPSNEKKGGEFSHLKKQKQIEEAEV